HVAPLSGRLAGVVVEFRDITDEVRAQEVLKEADRRKDEFIATLSHELRTPLTAILGWARILRMAGNDSETMSLGIETINRSAEVQAQLIDDVLDISRVTTGKLQIATDVVDVATVASSALDTVRLAAEAKQVRVKHQLEAKDALVLGDPNRLQQVIWNLLSNAIKFTPSGGVVELTVRRNRKNVEITVRDNGMGIRTDFLPHIFEAFRQADSATTRVHGGLGLGLSIVRYLVELHGGHITAESAGEGRGATFVVELPHLRANAASAEHVATPAAKVGLDDLSLLVIDDQGDVRDFLCTALRRGGARVYEAESVQSAIAAMQNGERFDLVLCDLAMPHEDGFEFMRWMREDPAAAKVPVYAITAFGREHHDEERVYEAGFAGFIRKPVEPDALLRIVAEAVSGRS
ncbi:MAG TPA: ATP-binding protein, partial [Thermoanaerobaculia bacterium]